MLSQNNSTFKHRSPTKKSTTKDKKRPSPRKEGKNGNHIQVEKRLVTILPPITPTPIYCFTRRFIASGSVSGAITIADLLNTHIFATTAVLGYSLFRSIRIRKIRWLSPVQTQGTTVTLAITPLGQDTTNNSFNSLPETYVDTSASIDKPAYLCLKPDIDTPLGSWHTSTTVSNNLLFHQCPQGTTMDVFLEGVPCIGTTPQGYTVVLAGATAGNQYCRNITTNFVPIGINNI